MPRVSVVIPTYNEPVMLAEALDSLDRQTFRDFETIVVNDGSAAETSRLLEARADRLRVIDQENRGIGAARNRGFDEAKGEFVAFLDHDDLWLPEKLAVQVAFMEANEHAIGCSVPYAYSSAPDQPAFDPQIAGADGLVANALDVYASGSMFMFTSAMMVRARTTDGIRFETSRNAFEDLPLHLKLLLRGAYGIADRRIHVIYRQHAANTTGKPRHFGEGIDNLRRLYADSAFGSLESSQASSIRKFIARFGRISATTQLLLGDRGNALRTYWREARYQAQDGNWRFALGFPILAMLPRSMARRLLSQ